MTRLIGNAENTSDLADVSGTLEIGNGGTGATTASNARTSLGLGSITTQDSNSVSITGGSITGVTDIAIADGGTGASTEAAARQNLGLEIGVDVQQHDADTTKNDVANTFTANQIISVTDNLNAALRVTQLGTGNALVVEDSANPDSTSFVVDASGNVGIGTSSPSQKLQVNGNIRLGSTASTDENVEYFITSSGQIVINSNNAATQNATFVGLVLSSGVSPNISGITIYGSSSSTFNNIRFSTNNTERMRIDESGNIGAPSGTNIYNASDQRLKQNITDLSGCLQKVLLMRGVSFNWIDGFCDSEADKTLYGLIAQELQTVDVNLVDSFSDNTITAGEVTVENPLRVNEKFIIPMLVESIKEQQALIESQQSQIDALTARIEALETT